MLQDLTISIPFMRFRKPGAVLSIVLVVASLAVIMIKGITYGLDFTGGTQIEMRYEVPPELESVRQLLEREGFTNNEVVSIGSDQNVLVRVQNEGESVDAADEARESGETAVRVSELLIEAADGQATMVGSTFVSSQVGEELKEQGGLGMLVATILLMLYITIRFQYKFAVGAVLSVAHDSIITLGFISLMELDFDLNVLASIMAIIGYSLNDTVVVADRIRENFRIMRSLTPEQIVDKAVSQTLMRTTVTAVTTLLVLLALLFYGGQVLYSFSLVLIVGILIGTYSSIYVASSTLIFMDLTQEDMTPEKHRDRAELDAIP